MSKTKTLPVIMTVDQVNNFLNSKTVPEIQNELISRIEQFKAELETGELSVEHLKNKEAELMKEFDVNDERIKQQTYPVSKSVEVNGKEFTQKEVVSFIEKFLGNIEVEFRAALGVYETILFFQQDFDGERIPHAVFDGTIRLLNTLKYKGVDDLAKIIAINNWFLPSHEMYSKNTIYTHYLSAKHQELLQLMNPQGNQ